MFRCASTARHHGCCQSIALRRTLPHTPNRAEAAGQGEEDIRSLSALAARVSRVRRSRSRRPSGRRPLPLHPAPARNAVIERDRDPRRCYRRNCCASSSRPRQALNRTRRNYRATRVHTVPRPYTRTKVSDHRLRLSEGDSDETRGYPPRPFLRARDPNAALRQLGVYLAATGQ